MQLKEYFATNKGVGVMSTADLQGITLDTEIDKETNTKGLVVIEHKEDLHPQILIVDAKTGDEVYEEIVRFSNTNAEKFVKVAGKEAPAHYVKAARDKVNEISGGI